MAVRRRGPRRTRPASPFRKRLDYPLPNPHKIAEETAGTCRIQLLMGTHFGSSRLTIDVQYKISIYDHRDDPKVWEDLCRRFWIGFDGSMLGFRIASTHAVESTLTLSCRYTGDGTLDRIRKLKKLRFAPVDDPKGGVLLDVIEVLPTARPKLPPKSRKG